MSRFRPLPAADARLFSYPREIYFITYPSPARWTDADAAYWTSSEHLLPPHSTLVQKPRESNQPKKIHLLRRRFPEFRRSDLKPAGERDIARQ